MIQRIALVLSVSLYFTGGVLFAASELPKYTITIKGHKFEPVELEVPANQKIKLIVDNQDTTQEEFESYELNREKIVGPGKQIEVYIGPLKQGTYKYFGDFHKNTAQGYIVAK